MNNSNDTIGNRNRDLPGGNPVPQECSWSVIINAARTGSLPLCLWTLFGSALRKPNIEARETMYNNSLIFMDSTLTRFLSDKSQD